MKEVLPRALSVLVERLGGLPGVGERTAQRYAYFILKNNESKNQRLAESIANLHVEVKLCPKTYALIDSREEISHLYTDNDRDKSLIAIVENPLDIIPIEKTGKFLGTYHVLGGSISPIDGVGPEQLHIPQLIERVKEDSVKEIILATNASVEGESTALYIQKQINEAGLAVKITRLAQGIPVGIDIEYADQITLSHALEGRRIF